MGHPDPSQGLHRSTAAMAAAALPDWMMLERFVFLRDDAASFPDEEEAPFTTSSTTSLGDPFRVAFLIVEPPAISRLYVQWPRGGLDPEVGVSCDLVAAQRDLVLFRLTCSPVMLDDSPFPLYQQDHVICTASSSSPPLLLKRIPLCTKPVVRGEEEFAMAQLIVVRRIANPKPEGELCVLLPIRR